MPMIPAINKMVVFPNHIKKFIDAIKPLVDHALSTNENVSGTNPDSNSILVTGPLLANNLKNNNENADAMTKLGIYMTVLYVC